MFRALVVHGGPQRTHSMGYVRSLRCRECGAEYPPTRITVCEDASRVDLQPGYTPLRRADNLARALDLRDVWVKDDTVNPTYSFKDRPVAVAIAKAREWGLEAVGCASTGNLAAATAAAAAKARLPCYV